MKKKNMKNYTMLEYNMMDFIGFLKTTYSKSNKEQIITSIDKLNLICQVDICPCMGGKSLSLQNRLDSYNYLLIDIVFFNEYVKIGHLNNTNDEITNKKVRELYKKVIEFAVDWDVEFVKHNTWKTNWNFRLDNKYSSEYESIKKEIILYDKITQLLSEDLFISWIKKNSYYYLIQKIELDELDVRLNLDYILK
jgi:hypothetical protein